MSAQATGRSPSAWTKLFVSNIQANAHAILNRFAYERTDAASDAYSGIQLFHILEQHRKDLDPCPPRPYYAELGLPIRLAGGVSIPTADENSEVVEPEGQTPAIATLSTSFIAALKERSRRRACVNAGR
jgi:hypothetical protein